MENLAAKVTAAFFDSKNLHYEMLGDDREAIRAGFSMKNREAIRVVMIFSDDNTDVKIRAYEVAKVPEGRAEKVYQVCNKLNRQYRWVKFYYNEDDRNIIAEDDVIIQLDNCGDEALQSCVQMVRIIDDAYPEIMRAIYA